MKDIKDLMIYCAGCPALYNKVTNLLTENFGIQGAETTLLCTFIANEILKDNKKNGNTSLRVYDETFGGDICGNCLGYINRDYNYCPQCGCKLEG